MTAVPHSSIYGNSNYIPSVVVKVDEATRIRRFDGAMHGSITCAKTKQEWLGIFAQVLTAYKEGNLRPNVRKRFEVECPHKDVLFRWQRETGTLPKPEKFAPSPLGGKTMSPQERREYEARRTNSRNKRHEKQPPKGKAGQKSESSRGKGKK